MFILISYCWQEELGQFAFAVNLPIYLLNYDGTDTISREWFQNFLDV